MVIPLFVKTGTVYINTACRTHTVICLRRPWGKHQWWWSLPSRSQHRFLLFLHHWDLKVWKYAFSSFWIIKNKQRRPRKIQQRCISWTSELDRVVRSWLKIINPGLERNLNSAIRAWKANSVFSLPTIWGLHTLKRIEKIIRGNAFDKKKKNPGLKFNPRLALTGVRTTGPRNENKNGEFSFV